MLRFRHIHQPVESPTSLRGALLALADPANALTVVRLPLAALVWLKPGDSNWLMGVLVVAGLSDVVDGRVARAVRRARGQGSRFSEAEQFGAWLDPVCDKLFVLSSLVAVIVGFGVAPEVALLTTARELLLAPVALLYAGSRSLRRSLRLDFHSDWLGKLTTVAQFVVIIALLYAPELALGAALTAGAIGVIATVHYLRRGLLGARYRERNPVAERVLRANS